MKTLFRGFREYIEESRGVKSETAGSYEDAAKAFVQYLQFEYEAQHQKPVKQIRLWRLKLIEFRPRPRISYSELIKQICNNSKLDEYLNYVYPSSTENEKRSRRSDIHLYLSEFQDYVRLHMNFAARTRARIEYIQQRDWVALLVMIVVFLITVDELSSVLTKVADLLVRNSPAPIITLTPLPSYSVTIETEDITIQPGEEILLTANVSPVLGDPDYDWTTTAGSSRKDEEIPNGLYFTAPELTGRSRDSIEVSVSVRDGTNRVIGESSIELTIDQRELQYSSRVAEWPTGSKGCFAYYVDSQGHFRHQINCLPGTATTIIEDDEFDNLDVEMRVRKVSGSDEPWFGIALVVENPNLDIYHRFMISSARTYTYEVNVLTPAGDQRDFHIIQRRTRSLEIQGATGLNNLRVVRIGREVAFYVNDVQLVCLNDFPAEANVKVALLTAPQATIPYTPSPNTSVIEVAFHSLEIFEPSMDIICANPVETGGGS